MSPDRTIHLLWTQKVIDTAAAAGLERATLTALMSSSAVRESGGHADRISLASHFEVWKSAMRQLDDPGFPIQVATRMHLDDYETLGLAVKTAANLRAAMDRVARYLSIWTDAYECRLRDDADATHLIIQTEGRGVGPRAAAESAVAEILHAMREITGQEISPRRAHFRHALPRDLSAHQRFFGCELRFASSYDGVELTHAQLDTPLALADEGLSKYLESRLQELSAKATPLSVIVQVQRIISDELPTGVPKMNDVARRLGVSGRSLQRQLAAGGGYAALVEQTRRALAENMLGATRHTLAEIAFLLGFSEPSAFHRAFKRWTGVTPASFRAPAR